MRGCGLDSSDTTVKVVGCCERGNEHLGSVRCEELIDLLRNC